jgi:hypothetical protein
MLGIATLARLKGLFEAGDVDKSGTLDSRELAVVLQQFCRQLRVARSIAAVKKEETVVPCLAALLALHEPR